MAFEKKYDPLPQVTEPVCLHMRTKGMYVRCDFDEPAENPEESSSHCWCNLTQRVQGPDSREVVRESCVPGRECYERRL